MNNPFHYHRKTYSWQYMICSLAKKLKILLSVAHLGRLTVFLFEAKAMINTASIFEICQTNVTLLLKRAKLF